MIRVLLVIIACLTLIAAFPSVAAGADETLDNAVAKIKKMVSGGKTEAEIAQAVSDIVDDRVTNVNSLERLTEWRNVFDFVPGIDNPKEAEFDKFRARGIPEYDETAKWVWDSQYGQCAECASLAYYLLKKSGVPGNYRIYTTTAGSSGHNFVVWGMKDGADPNDPTTWGPDAYVVDGWKGKALNAEEAHASSTYSNEGEAKITDGTKAYDKTAAVWKIEEEGGSLSEYFDECFIATAALDTSAHDKIDILRDFRDGYLRRSGLGQAFITFYYDNSPPVAHFIRDNEALRSIVRYTIVDPAVWVVQMTDDLWN